MYSMKPFPQDVRGCNRWCTSKEFVQKFLKFLQDAEETARNIKSVKGENSDLGRDMKKLLTIIEKSKPVLEDMWKHPDEWFPVGLLYGKRLGTLPAGLKVIYEFEEDRYEHMPVNGNGKKMPDRVPSKEFVVAIKRLAAVWNVAVAFLRSMSPDVLKSPFKVDFTNPVGAEDDRVNVTFEWSPPEEWMH